MSRREVLLDLHAERDRQARRYNNDETLDGTGPDTRWLLPISAAPAVELEAILREGYLDYEEEAPVTWVHLLREEFAEVVVETDPEKLYAELGQLGALCVSWMEQLRRRNPSLRV